MFAHNSSSHCGWELQSPMRHIACRLEALLLAFSRHCALSRATVENAWFGGYSLTHPRRLPPRQNQGLYRKVLPRFTVAPARRMRIGTLVGSLPQTSTDLDNLHLANPSHRFHLTVDGKVIHNFGTASR